MKEKEMTRKASNGKSRGSSVGSSLSGSSRREIIDTVAGSLEDEPCRGHIERIVKETVRPCAIGGVPTVLAGGIAAVGSFAEVSPAAIGKVDISIHCGDPVGTCGGGSTAGSPVDMAFPVSSDGDKLLKMTDDRKVKKGITSSLTEVDKTSKWFGIVLQNGEVWTPYTSRRFLPAQYLRLMHDFNGNVDAAIACRYSLRDCFKLLETEVEKMDFIQRYWRTAFPERSRFLTVADTCNIVRQYCEALRENINDRDKCTFSERTGEYWRNIQGHGRMVLWTQSEKSSDGPNGSYTEKFEIAPTEWLVRLNRQIEECLGSLRSVNSYSSALFVIRSKMPHISMGTFKDSEGRFRYWLPKAWKEAFKRQGAYYTLKSLIVNLHVRYTTESGDWRNRKTTARETAREGLVELRKLIDENAPAYVIHAILKKSIEASRFDIGKFLKRNCR